jgi:patatin-like phospholipase/acyl hydrolase
MLGYLKKEVTILSIDGGGIRGIIPALLLEELDRRITARKKNRPLCRVFDLIAGTSTGSILTLGLTAPADLPESGGNDPAGRAGAVSAEAAASRGDHRQQSRRYSREPLFSPGDLVDIYNDHGLEIFPPHIFKQLKTVRQAFTEKYNSGRLYEILEEKLGDRTLQDALTNVLVTSYDLTNNNPLIMKKRPHPMARRDRDPNFFIKDAIMGSSAAPTFFEPVQVSTVDGSSSHLLVDGSVFAKNPAMCALVEAQKIYPRARHFTVLSLGTGEPDYPYTYAQMRTWGFIEWVLPSRGVPLAAIMNNGQARCVNYQLQYLPRVDYHRFEVPLDGCSRSMDDAAPENMKCLHERAAELIREKDAELDLLAGKLA